MVHQRRPGAARGQGVLLAAGRFQSAAEPVKAKPLARSPPASLDSPAVRPERRQLREGRSRTIMNRELTRMSGAPRGVSQQQCDGQLWLRYDWPAPTERVAVSCAACSWRGQRARHGCTHRPCPRCGAQVDRGRWPVSPTVDRSRQGRPSGGRPASGGSAHVAPHPAPGPGPAAGRRSPRSRPPGSTDEGPVHARDLAELLLT